MGFNVGDPVKVIKLVEANNVTNLHVGEQGIIAKIRYDGHYNVQFSNLIHNREFHSGPYCMYEWQLELVDDTVPDATLIGTLGEILVVHKQLLVAIEEQNKIMNKVLDEMEINRRARMGGAII